MDIIGINMYVHMYPEESAAAAESIIAVIQSSDNYLVYVDVLYLANYSDFFRCAFYGANQSYAERQHGCLHLATIAHAPLVRTLSILRELTDRTNTMPARDFMTAEMLQTNKATLESLKLMPALEVLDVAAYLQIGVVLEAVADVIFRQVTALTLPAVHRQVEKRYVPLAMRLWRVVVGEFAVLVRTGTFLELSAEQLLTLLRDPELNLEPDEEYPVVSKWLDANGTEMDAQCSIAVMELRTAVSAYMTRLSDLPSARPTLARPTTSPSSSPSFTLSTISPTISLSDNAISDQNPPDVLPPGIGFYNSPRIPHSVLLAIGGWASGGPSNQLEFYDAIRHKWMPVQTGCALACPERRAYHTIIRAADRFADSTNNCLYMIGGYDGFHHRKSVHKLNLDSWKWSEMAGMNEQRCYISGDALDNRHILVAGGFNENDRLRNAEIFDIALNQWTMCASMNAIRSDADCVNVQNRIYIVGGFDGNMCHSSCEFYDWQRNKWMSVGQPMRFKRSGVKTTRVGSNVIFVAGGFTGSVRLRTPEFYDTREGIWHLVADMINKRSNFGIDTFDNRVVVCGGYNNVSTTNLCEAYEFRANRWINMPEMSFSRSALALTRIDRHPIIADVIAEYDYSVELPFIV